jgi:DnaD/phage-associated family protein
MSNFYTRQDLTNSTYIKISKGLFYGKKYSEPITITKLIKGETKEFHFKQLSYDARALYGIYQDRYEFSMYNGLKDFIDDDGHIFCYCTNEEILFYTKWGKERLARVKTELFAYGLMIEKRQGINKPNRIYILKTPSDLEMLDFKKYKEEREEEAKKINKTLDNTGRSETEHPDVERTFGNRTSRSSDSEHQDVRIPNTSNHDINNKDDDDINISSSSNINHQKPVETIQQKIKSDFGIHLSNKQQKTINHWLEIMSLEIILEMLDYCSEYSAKSFVYLEKAFEDWRQKGIVSVVQARIVNKPTRGKILDIHIPLD